MLDWIAVACCGLYTAGVVGFIVWHERKRDARMMTELRNFLATGQR